MMPTFTHFALHVRNVDASVKFYSEFCGLEVLREHGGKGNDRTVWMGEPNGNGHYVIVITPGGGGHDQQDGDLTHYGFAVADESTIDRVADKARNAGCLAWEPVRHHYPVGYLCGLRDPDGYIVEFSFGQPLGPAAEKT